MSLPFVTRGKMCPNPNAHEKRRTAGSARRKKPPPWRPPPCKFEKKVRRPSGAYCSVCVLEPSSNNRNDDEGDSLQNLKDLNSSIHRLDEEIRRQRGKVMNDLIRMDEKQETWEKTLRKGTELVCTCNLNYKSLEGKDSNGEGNPEEDSTHVSESLKKDPIKKELESASSSSFYSQSSKQTVPHKRKKRRKKVPPSDNKEMSLDAPDSSKALLIAQLKNENDRLKSDLQERESKLREAGKKIEEILEQNAVLTHRLKEVTFKGLTASSSGDGKGKWGEIDVHHDGGESYQKELSLLRQKLSDSQVANRNLEIYIDYLKKSYVSVFGSVVTST